MAWNDSFKKSCSIRFVQILGLSLLASSSLVAQEMSSQEAFLLRKISEYWKENELGIAKSQILHFLEKYPQSQAKDMLVQLLGDLYVKEKEFSTALKLYEGIKEDKIAKKSDFNKAICLYELKMYQELIDHASVMLAQPHQGAHSDTVELFLAESFLKKAQDMPAGDLQNSYFESALSLFDKLTKTKYADRAFLPAAELSVKLGKNADACKFYQELLEKTPEDRESILYKIASLQAHYKPKEAIQTYALVYKLKGKMASEAAIQQLQILFKEQKYKDLLLYQEEALRYISPNKQYLAQYWIGKSLFHLNEFSEAEKHLEHALSNPHMSDIEQKSLIKTLSLCASRTKNIQLMTRMIQKWEALLPGDREIADAYIMQYQMLQNQDKMQAAQVLETVIEKYPEHKEKENLLFNLCMLRCKLSQWDVAERYLRSYIDTYPDSKQVDLCIKQHINCLIEQVNSAPETARLAKKETLVVSIDHALTKNMYSKEEKKKIQFTQCILLVDLNRANEAQEKISAYIKQYPKAENLSDAYLMLAKVQEDSESNIDSYILCLEKVLSLSSQREDMAMYHSKLFNAYIKKAAHATENDKVSFLEKAADHLYIVYLSENPIRGDNLAWLSNFYYETAKSCMKDKHENLAVSLQRAKTLIETMLEIDSYPPTFDITKDPERMEKEILKLSDLLSWQNKQTERVDLLEFLVHNQNESQELGWKHRAKSKLELARAYKESGNIAESLATYDQVIASSEYASSYSANLALLESSKLKYIELKNQHISNDSTAYQELLDRLKELQIKKKAYQEPLHLEAAFTYIDIKMSLIESSEKKSKKLLLLKGLKESFSSPEDPSTAQYLSSLSTYPEKQVIVSTYMKLADFMILYIEKEIASSQMDAKQAKVALTILEKELKELKKDPNLPPELTNRIANSMEAQEKRL